MALLVTMVLRDSYVNIILKRRVPFSYKDDAPAYCRHGVQTSLLHLLVKL